MNPRRKRKRTPELEAKVYELRHLAQHDIAKRLGVSKGLVNAILQNARNSPPLPKAVEPSVAAAEVASPDAEASDDIETSLRRALSSLERAARAAETEKDVARMVSAARAAAQVAGLVAKVAPPPITSVDDRPDMIAAARRCRDRMENLLKRIIREVTP